MEKTTDLGVRGSTPLGRANFSRHLGNTLRSEILAGVCGTGCGRH